MREPTRSFQPGVCPGLNALASSILLPPLLRGIGLAA